MAPTTHIVAVTMLLLVVSALSVTPGITSDDGPISPNVGGSSFQKPPEEAPGFYEYLISCSRKFIKNCGFLTFSAIVYGNVTFTPECCGNIVNNVGKTCYDNLIIPVLDTPAFKANASQIATSNKQVWNRCASIANSSPPSY